jgi:hypothetical protein
MQYSHSTLGSGMQHLCVVKQYDELSAMRRVQEDGAVMFSDIVVNKDKLRLSLTFSY